MPPAAHALGDQHACTRDSGRVELPELHVLERQPGARDHAEAVAGVDVGVRRGVEDASCAARRQYRDLCFEDHQFAGFHFKSHYANDCAFGVAHEVERHPFDEELRAFADIALIQRVQQCVAGAIRRSARARDRLFAEIGRVPAERPLVDRAVRITVKRHAEVLELVDDLRRFATHELDRILVAEIVRALTVSNMCQSQLSSVMLPSEAPMPCAATVCERVGKTWTAPRR